LELEKQLRKNTPVEVEAAKARYEQEKSSDPPPPPRTKLDSMSEAQEMAEAASRLGEAVDRICEALVLVFGKISAVSDTSHGQALALRSMLKWVLRVALIQIVVCVAMVYLAIMGWQTSQSAMQTHASQLQAVKTIEDLTLRTDKLLRASEETKQKVDEVRKSADEMSTVQLTMDPYQPGGAIVRIVPPRGEGSATVEDTSVEIPIKMDSARRGDGGRK